MKVSLQRAASESESESCLKLSDGVGNVRMFRVPFFVVVLPFFPGNQKQSLFNWDVFGAKPPYSTHTFFFFSSKSVLPSSNFVESNQEPLKTIKNPLKQKNNDFLRCSSLPLICWSFSGAKSTSFEFDLFTSWFQGEQSMVRNGEVTSMVYKVENVDTIHWFNFHCFMVSNYQLDDDYCLDNPWFIRVNNQVITNK